MTFHARFAHACTAVAIAALLSMNASAADVDAGKKKVQEVCAACHGIDGATPTSDVDYVRQLLATGVLFRATEKIVTQQAFGGLSGQQGRATQAHRQFNPRVIRPVILGLCRLAQAFANHRRRIATRVGQ